MAVVEAVEERVVVRRLPRLRPSRHTMYCCWLALAVSSELAVWMLASAVNPPEF